MALPSQELSLVALSVLVDHDAVTELVVLEAALEGPALVEAIVAYHFFIVLPVSTELVAVGVSIHPFSISFAVLDAALVVLCF